MPYAEITGYDEITGGLVGDDAADALLSMTGAAAPSRTQMRNYHPRVIDVKQVDARAPRQLVIGFSAASVAAGVQAVISVLPQVIFRGQRLVVPSDIAGSFSIDDIIVGNRSQLVSAGALPARAFQENCLNNELHLDTASVSQQLILKVTNTSAGALAFSAALFGTAAIP